MTEIFVEPAWGKFKPPFKREHVTVHDIFNESEDPVAFKLKSSDDNNFRCKPIYGLIRPRTQQGITIRCIRERAPSEELLDKVKVCLKAIDPADADNYYRNSSKSPKDFFRDGEIHGFVEIFLLTQSRNQNKQSCRSKSRVDIDEVDQSRIEHHRSRKGQSRSGQSRSMRVKKVHSRDEQKRIQRRRAHDASKMDSDPIERSRRTTSRQSHQSRRRKRR